MLVCFHSVGETSYTVSKYPVYYCYGSETMWQSKAAIYSACLPTPCISDNFTVSTVILPSSSTTETLKRKTISLFVLFFLLLNNYISIVHKAKIVLVLFFLIFLMQMRSEGFLSKTISKRWCF